MKTNSKSINQTTQDCLATGPEIFIVHGWSLRQDIQQQWQPVIDRLSRAGYIVKFLKLPGLQTKLDEAWYLNDYRDWVLSQIKGSRPAVLIGHSFGGQIAAAAAAQKPDSLEHLILIAPAGMIAKSLPKTIKRSVFKAIAKAGNLVFGKGKSAEIGRKVLYKLARETDYHRASPNLKKTMINALKTEITDQLPNIQVPTLLIWGENDRYTPFKHAKIFQQKIRGSQLEKMEQAGHFPYRCQPDLVADKILQFLKT